MSEAFPQATEVGSSTSKKKRPRSQELSSRKVEKETSQTIERLTHLDEQIAIIIRASHQVDNLEFFTQDEDPLQVGMHQKKAGVSLTPHIHISNTKMVIEIHEVLYIVKGKVKVTYYTPDAEVIVERILNAGDILIHQKMGHGFEILEDAQIFEVKQGPYPGTKHAKIYFEGSKA